MHNQRWCSWGIVSAEGIGTAEHILAKIRQCQPPRNKSELRTFLGLTNYYMTHAPWYAHVALPLYRLLHQRAEFLWSPECTRAFSQLKRLLTTAPVLRFPDFARQFILHCDASGTAVGAVLTQVDDEGVEHPVKFLSKALSPAQCKYSIGELECLAVLLAIRKWKKFIAGTTISGTTHMHMRAYACGAVDAYELSHIRSI